MLELLFTLGSLGIILLTTIATLKYSRIKGLRSKRGIILCAMLLVSWVFCWVVSTVFVPAAFVVVIFVQMATFVFVSKTPLLKSAVISVIYTGVTVALLLGLTLVTLGQQFS